MSDRAPWLKTLPAAARFILQGSAESFTAVAVELGLAADDTPCRALSNEAAALLWLGPDERLIIVWGADPAAFGERLERALAAAPHSLVDVTQRQIGFELKTAFAEDLLNCGCPQDLSLAQFPIDKCSRTLYNKTDIVLWRRGSDTFHIEVWRSFAPYLVGWMQEAAQDLA